MLTLASASPLPIDTNEVASWEAQVHYFGCFLIECFANLFQTCSYHPVPPSPAHEDSKEPLPPKSIKAMHRTIPSSSYLYL